MHGAIRKSVIFSSYVWRSNARRSSFHDLIWDRNPLLCACSLSRVNFPLPTSNGLKMMEINSRKDCRHPCAVWATSVTRSQLRIPPRIVEEHPSCCTPQCQQQAKVEFAGLNFQVDTGSSYLGIFIGEATKRDSWIATNKVGAWVYSVQKACRCLPTDNAQHQTLNHALIY